MRQGNTTFVEHPPRYAIEEQPMAMPGLLNTIKIIFNV